MEQVVVGLLVGLVQAVPKVVDMVRQSQTLSDDQKKLLLANIQDELDAASKKVIDVQFKDT